MSVPYPEAAIKAEATETHKRQVLHDLCLISVGVVAAGHSKSVEENIAMTVNLYEALARVVERKVK